jgi:hypothetical protein
MLNDMARKCYSRAVFLRWWSAVPWGFHSIQFNFISFHGSYTGGCGNSHKRKQIIQHNNIRNIKKKTYSHCK